MKKYIRNLSFITTGIILSACGQLSMAQKHCVEPQVLYKTADMRKVDTELFQRALTCENPETVKVALVALGRIGGVEAANLIKTQLGHSDSQVRSNAAFASGISLSADLVPTLAERLAQEASPRVQEKLALAIGNLGHDESNDILYQVINKAQSDEAVRGAMQGLGLLALFHRGKIKQKQDLDVDKVVSYLANPKTSLEASFVMARIPLINDDHAEKIMPMVDSLDPDTQAFVIRALGNLKLKDSFDWFYQRALSDDIGVRVSAIQALGRLPIGGKEQVNKMNQLAKSDDWITSMNTLESASDWLTLQTLSDLMGGNNSWLAGLAFTKTNDPKPKNYSDYAYKWLESNEVNLQRSAANYFVENMKDSELNKWSKSKYQLTANAANQKLGNKIEQEHIGAIPTPEALDALPKRLIIKTTKGDIKIRLFNDTPYTSANFVKLAKEGFYNKTYFHRVIPNFVAQGGSRYGDGNGVVNYSIREELNQRSHRFGTIGMATSGKDTAGGQFFINLAPNLHLDSNYTVFGEVISGMDVVLKLQQSDQVVAISW